MKKLLFSLLIMFSLTGFSTYAQSDSIAKSYGIAPEIIEKLNGEQLLELVKEKERLRQEHETAMAEKFGVNGQDFIKNLMPSGFVMVSTTIVFFAFLIMLFVVPFYFNQRKSKMRFNLFSKLIDNNKDIPKEFLLPDKKPRTDLHKAIILVSIGLSVGLFLYLLKLEKSYWTIGLIPTIIGIGYFLSFILDKNNQNIEQY